MKSVVLNSNDLGQGFDKKVNVDNVVLLIHLLSDNNKLSQ